MEDSWNTTKGGAKNTPSWVRRYVLWETILPTQSPAGKAPEREAV